MPLTPREVIVIQRYLVEGCSLAELRRLIRDPQSGRMLPVARIKQIVAKAGRKATFYNAYFARIALPLSKFLSAGVLPMDDGGCCVYCDSPLMQIAMGRREEIPLTKHRDTCVWRLLVEAVNQR